MNMIPHPMTAKNLILVLICSIIAILLIFIPAMQEMNPEKMVNGEPMDIERIFIWIAIAIPFIVGANYWLYYGWFVRLGWAKDPRKKNTEDENFSDD